MRPGMQLAVAMAWAATGLAAADLVIQNAKILTVTKGTLEGSVRRRFDQRSQRFGKLHGWN
jgi:hypothetical protein